MQAIVDFVHSHIEFDYMRANAMKSAFDVYRERAGVCRDFAHLAVALCRCMNIPARYCTGYLGDIGIRLDPDPMDYSAWFEVYLGGRWYTFDARHNKPRIGRIVIARERDAAESVPAMRLTSQSRQGLDRRSNGGRDSAADRSPGAVRMASARVPPI